MSKTRNQTPQDGRKPVLLIAIGRQRVGKTTFLNAVGQYFKERGADLRLWNADQANSTHTLNRFDGEAVSAPQGGAEDTMAWIEGRMMEQIEQRYDAILDVGGGETALTQLAEETQLVEQLEGAGIRPVAVHLLGAEFADLDYLNNCAGEGMFSPEATLLVLNQGLLRSGRNADFAFGKIYEHETFKDAMRKGAKVAMMPALSCMAQVTDRGLSFSDAANGKQVAGYPPTSIFDRSRVATWWQKSMPAFFAEINPEWLPRLPVAAPTPAEAAE